MRRPAMPRSRNSGSTTLSGSPPMRQVPTGWKIVRADVACRAFQLLVRLAVRPGLELDGIVAGESGLRDDAAGEPDRLHGHVPVGLGRQVARADVRRRGEIRAFQMYGTAAFRPQIADARGDGGKGCTGSPNFSSVTGCT